MSGVDCVWYVSDFRRPWEAAVLGSVAAACGALASKALEPKNSGSGPAGPKFRPRIYVEGGTANFRADGVLSWKSLTFFERLRIVLFEGKLWHLWGGAPRWWGWVRLRTRTVHTSLEDAPKWRGHPTRLFAKQAKEGESLVVPTFESKAAWADDGENERENALPPALLLAAPPPGDLKEALQAAGIEGIPLGDSGVNSSLKGRVGLFTDDLPSNVLLAACLTMRGVPVMGNARGMTLLRSVLGPDGFIVPRARDREEGENWPQTLDALAESGRAASASARRFLKANYSASRSAESLGNLYRSVLSGAGDKNSP